MEQVVTRSNEQWLQKPIKAVLLDITGVLYESGTNEAINGSVKAIESLRATGLPFRLVTNETQNPIETLCAKLNRFGYDFKISEIIAPAPTTRKYLEHNQLRPYLLVHSRLLPEFDGIPRDNPNCVVVGDAADNFTYKAMNGAFQLMMTLKDDNDKLTSLSPSMLISMGKNKYYKEHGQLTIDLGAYTTALEYATDVKALIIGKPSPEYFKAAVDSLNTDNNIQHDEVVMIGDDIVGDVKGAQEIGMRGVLVRTGKFRPSDANHPSVQPDAIVSNLLEAIEKIVQRCTQSK